MQSLLRTASSRLLSLLTASAVVTLGSEPASSPSLSLYRDAARPPAVRAPGTPSSVGRLAGMVQPPQLVDGLCVEPVPESSQKWIHRVDEYGFDWWGVATGLTATYVAGRFYGASVDINGRGSGPWLVANSGTPDALLVKYDRDGTVVWSREVDGEGYFEKVHVAPDGDVYTVGWLRGPGTVASGVSSPVNLNSAGGDAMFVARLDPSGNYRWIREIGAFTGTISIDPSDLAVDESGSVYVVGNHGGCVDFNPGAGTHSITAPSGARYGFLLKLNVSGDFEWVRPMYATTGSYVYPTGVTVAGPRVAIAGNLHGSPIVFGPTPTGGYVTLETAGEWESDSFVASFEADGDLYNAVCLGNDATDDSAMGLVSNAAGEVFVTGYAYSSGGLAFGTNDVVSSTGPNGWVGYVAKLGIKLNLEWIVGAAPEADSHCYAMAIAIDATGCNLYVTGSYHGGVDFDPTEASDRVEALSSPGSDGSTHIYDASNLFIWSLDCNGRHSWVESPGFGPEPGSGGSGQDIAISPLGRLSVVGWLFDSGISTAGAFINRK
jgi:hypothetical protein